MVGSANCPGRPTRLPRSLCVVIVLCVAVPARIPAESGCPGSTAPAFSPKQPLGGAQSALQLQLRGGAPANSKKVGDGKESGRRGVLSSPPGVKRSGKSKGQKRKPQW